jgi:glycine cleavage system aminomethyltransferase T
MTDDNSPRRTPIYDKHQDLGAVTDSLCGWELPMYYESNEQRSDEFDLPTHLDESSAVGIEHLSTRETVGISDVTVLAPIEISGSAAPEFVQRAFTNDMDIDVGQVRYTILLNDDGENMGDLTVTRLDDNQYFAFTLGGEEIEKQTQWLRSIASDDVSVNNLDDSYTNISLWGPNASEVVSPLTDADMSRDGFPYYRSKQFEVAGVPAVLLRISYVGEFGWELWTRPGHQAQLWEALWESGQEHGITPLGLDALLRMGLEKGYRLPGYDMGPDNSPFEAKLHFTVDMDTDFVGKDILQRELDEGVDQRLACITMDTETVLPDIGEPVLVDGDVAGEVNRNGYGYSVQENIVTAYLPSEAANPGTSVKVESAGERYPATVREEPLFDPDNTRMRD